MKEGERLPEVRHEITQDKIERYAQASGDYNPVHLDAEYAATTQFGRTIAHGMLIAATISELMTAAFQRDWLESGKLKIRFRAPVFPGDTITATGVVKSAETTEGGTAVACGVDVLKQTGEVAIAGDATLLVTDKR